jgi:hypothetical protein
MEVQEDQVHNGLTDHIMLVVEEEDCTPQEQQRVRVE